MTGKELIDWIQKNPTLQVVIEDGYNNYEDFDIYEDDGKFILYINQNTEPRLYSILTQDESKVLERVIKEKGAEYQLGIVQEECAELIQAISKVRRANLISKKHIKHDTMNFDNNMLYHNLCSEIADVIIVLEQMLMMVNSDTVQLNIERKNNRLSERLNNESTAKK